MIVKLMLMMNLLWELHVQVAILKDDWLNRISNDNILDSMAVSILVHLELFCSMIHSTMLNHPIVRLVMMLCHMLVWSFHVVVTLMVVILLILKMTFTHAFLFNVNFLKL